MPFCAYAEKKLINSINADTICFAKYCLLYKLKLFTLLCYLNLCY